MTSDIISQFRDEMAKRGILTDVDIIPDANLHRFHVRGDSNGSSNGWYILFIDGVPSGAFGCWKRNISETWCSKSKESMTPAEWQTHVSRITECKRQSELTFKQRHDVAAREANKIWALATEENASEHDYLRCKNAKSYGLRILTKNVTYDVYPEERDRDGKKIIHKVYKNTLLIPCYNANNELVNLERIYFDKKENKFQKRGLTGGKRTSTFYMLGEVADPQGTIYICEGYSSTASVYESTKCPSVVSFNCGNLPNVIKLLRLKYPQSRLVIIADDDKWHDDPKIRCAGLRAAKKACTDIKNATFLLPNFGVLGLSEENLAELKPTDVNDLFALLLANRLNRTAALDIVRQQLTINLDEEIMAENTKEEKPKSAEVLLQLIDAGEFEFFHDESQDPFCKYPSQKSNVYEVRRINDRQFKSYLSFIYRKAEGKTIGEAALKEVLSELEGRSLHDRNSKQKKVFLRAGELNGKIYVDLCDDKWQVIEISSSGWQILDSKNVPIRFERSQHALPLPDPNSAKTGDISKLWGIVNIPEDDRILVLAYILECYRCTTAFPILLLLGLQDSGKSATQITLRSLIDPSSSNLRTAPRKVDDLVTEAGSNWLVSYNNVSSLSDEMHDDFCCIATGSGFATRKYYTNTQQIVVNIARPVVINGIFNFIRRPDLLDRAIILELDSIDESKRKTDEQLSKAVQENLPAIFRGLLDLFVKVLGLLPNVTLDRKPRMADFALLGVAVEKALELSDGTFINRYRSNRADAKDSILDSSPVMLALVEFIEQQENKFWRGRPSELLDELTKFKDPSIHTAWPKTPRAMGGELRRYTAPLYGAGIQVINEAKTSGKKNREGNIYQITKMSAHRIYDEKTSPQCPPSPHNDAKPNDHGASEDGGCVDLDVDIAAKSTTKSTRSPHTNKSVSLCNNNTSKEDVDIVGVVDFKTDHRKLVASEDDSILI